MRLTRADHRAATAARRGGLRAAAASVAVAAAVLAGVGCDVKSFLDPTEMFPDVKTPLQKPILTSLSAIDPSIDDPEDEFYGAQAPQPQDRLVVSRDYRIVPGDTVLVTVSGLQTEPGMPTTTQNQVSESGNINLQLVSPVKAEGLTEAELQRAVAQAYKDANILSQAVVSVQVAEARGRSFSILGAVNAPGQYFIQKANFRVLDALVLSRDTLASVDEVYVIRQVKEDPTPDQIQQSAQPAVPTLPAMPMMPTTGPSTGPAPADPLALPHSDAGPMPGGPPLSLMLQTPAGNGLTPATATPRQQTQASTPQTATTPNSGGRIGGQQPIGGYPTGTGGSPPYPGSPGAAVQNYGNSASVTNGGTVNGAGGQPTGGHGMAGQDQVPQGPSSGGGGGGGTGFAFNAPYTASDTRTIRVPLSALRAGLLDNNIVIRPGDLIIAPQPVIGEYYMGGHVLRTGVYSLTARKITIKMAIISAGMYDGLAIPERTELYRRIGVAREAFVRLDVNAIFTGDQPDLFLKPNDQIMVGTNALAPFIAAVRQGFRITYGFGFLYDRNFAPQTPIGG